MILLTLSKYSIIAQRWADQCPDKSWWPKVHDDHRFFREDEKAGQNIASRGYSENDPTYHHFNVKSMIKGWYDEVKSFPGGHLVENIHPIGPMVGHYTQMVWAKTRLVGCGTIYYKKGDYFTKVF